MALLFAFNANAQCPPGDVAFTTQAQVNQFKIDYPNCKEIDGFLKIQVSSGSSDITDLSPLNNITSIKGNLEFNNNQSLKSINGLENLTTISGGLSFYNNGLQNIDELNKIQNLGGHIFFGNNPALQNLNGLASVTKIGGHIDISDNAILNDISGLQNIAPTWNATYGITIQKNPALAVCNLPNFCTYLANDKNTHPRNIAGNLANCLDEAAVVTACTTLSECPTGDVVLASQADVNNFKINYPNCTQIEGYLNIGPWIEEPQGNITNVEPLAKITQVNGGLYIQNNALLQNVNGLNISKVGGNLFIGGNDFNSENSQLQNIDGLSKLTSIGEYLEITHNPLLTNVSGLSNLKEISNDIYIVSNTVLSDISGLENTTFNAIDTLGLTIIENPALSVCNLTNFCAYLDNDKSTHPRNIHGNLADCIDEAAVIAACKALSVDGIGLSSITVYPNPAKEVIHFSKDVFNVRIEDASGRTVKQLSDTRTSSVNLSDLSKGIYVISATTEEGARINKKIIKE